MVKDVDTASPGIRAAAGLRSRPIRKVLGWQLVATVGLAVLSAVLAEPGAAGNNALSSMLGGLVSLVAGVASAWMAGRGRTDSAAGVLFVALRAEAVKLGLIVVLLWLAFATYRELATPWFLGTFALTTVVFSMAFFVRDAPLPQSPQLPRQQR